jgi:hypothetical protein
VQKPGKLALASVKWWEQACGEAQGKKPLLIFTRNHYPIFCMMWWDDFVDVGCSRIENMMVLKSAKKAIVVFLFTDMTRLTTPAEWRQK